MKENLLVVICCLNEAEVVLQCGNKSMQSLGVGGVAVEDPDGDGALLASSLHFIDGELHLEDKQRSHMTEYNSLKVLHYSGENTGHPFSSLFSAHLKRNIWVGSFKYLVSCLWLASSLQILSVVWHSELHSTVFIRNHPFLRLLQTRNNTRYISITIAEKHRVQPRQSAWSILPVSQTWVKLLCESHFLVRP